MSTKNPDLMLSPYFKRDTNWPLFISTARAFFGASPRTAADPSAQDDTERMESICAALYGLGAVDDRGDDQIDLVCAWDELSRKERARVVGIVEELTPQLIANKVSLDSWMDETSRVINQVCQAHGWDVAQVEGRFTHAVQPPSDAEPKANESTSLSDDENAHRPTLANTRLTISGQPQLGAALSSEPRWTRFVQAAQAFFFAPEQSSVSAGGSKELTNLKALYEFFLGLSETDKRGDDKIGVSCAWDGLTDADREEVLDILDEFTPQLLKDEGKLEEWMIEAAHAITFLCKKHDWKVGDVVGRFLSSIQPPASLSDDEADHSHSAINANSNSSPQPQANSAFNSDKRWINFGRLCTEFMDSTDPSDGQVMTSARSDLRVLHAELAALGRASPGGGAGTIWDQLTAQQRTDIFEVMRGLNLLEHPAGVDSWARKARKGVDSILSGQSLDDSDSVDNLSDTEHIPSTVNQTAPTTLAQPQLSPSLVKDSRWVNFDHLATAFMENCDPSDTASMSQARQAMSLVYSELCALSRSPSTGKTSFWGTLTPVERADLFGVLTRLTLEVFVSARRVHEWIALAREVIHVISNAHHLTEQDVEGNLSDEEGGYGGQAGERFEGGLGGVWIVSE